MRDEEMIIALTLMSIIGGVIIVKTMCAALTRMVCHWADVTLKIRLVSAGMKADEIEQVIMASRRMDGFARWSRANGERHAKVNKVSAGMGQKDPQRGAWYDYKNENAYHDG